MQAARHVQNLVQETACSGSLQPTLPSGASPPPSLLPSLLSVSEMASGALRARSLLWDLF